MKRNGVRLRDWWRSIEDSLKGLLNLADINVVSNLLHARVTLNSRNLGACFGQKGHEGYATQHITTHWQWVAPQLSGFCNPRKRSSSSGSSAWSGCATAESDSYISINVHLKTVWEPYEFQYWGMPGSESRDWDHDIQRQHLSKTWFQLWDDAGPRKNSQVLSVYWQFCSD